MSRLTRATLLFTWAIGAGFVAAALKDLRELPAMPFTLLLILGIISEMKPMPYSLGRESKETTLSPTIILATLFIFDWSVAVLLAVACVAVADVLSTKPYYKILFNASAYAIATSSAAFAYRVITTMPSLTALLPEQTMPILGGLAAGLAYYSVNEALLMGLIAQLQGTRMLRMILWDVRDSAMITVTLTSIAIAMAMLWRANPATIVVLSPAIFMAKVGYDAYARLRREAHALVSALADMLDLRDHITGLHSVRVAELAWGVAQRLGLAPDHVLAVRTIARVHDIGKVAISDAVLKKPGLLTPQEQSEMRTHVEAGAQILGHLSVYQHHLPILVQHHERLDGQGYPARLKGDEIDIGARILAVCDAYDSMTTPRPYREALSPEAAMAELLRESGRQFDNGVVQALEDWLIGERRLKVDWRVRQAPFLPRDGEVDPPIVATNGTHAHPSALTARDLIQPL